MQDIFGLSSGLFSRVGLMGAFAGGIFGACFGALMSFVFIAVICGVVGGIAAVDGGSTMVWTVGFGADGVHPWSFYAPQIAWAGAIFAVGYAKKKGYLGSGKDIISTLLGTRRPDALLMGGVGGVIGYLIVALESIQFGPSDAPITFAKWVDPVAFSVVATALIGKLIWDRTLVGETPRDVRELRGGRFNVNAPAWLPYLSSGTEKLCFGGALGLGAGWVASTFLASQSPAVQSLAFIVPWTIAVLSLLGFFTPGYNMPASHHIAYSGAFGAILSAGAGQSLGIQLMWAFGMGILAAFAADFVSRIFHNYGGKVGGTWVDPPTSAILVASLFLRWIFNPLFAHTAAGVVVPLVIFVLALGVAFVDRGSLAKAEAARAKVEHQLTGANA
jgi:hypothetical protein